MAYLWCTSKNIICCIYYLKRKWYSNDRQSINVNALHYFLRILWAKEIKVSGKTCIIWVKKEELFWQSYLAPKKTIERRRCLAENPTLSADNLQLYRAWILLQKKPYKHWIPKNESNVYIFFIEQTVLSLIKSIFTEMKYFSQNIIEPS